jgi:aspartyl-tRNA(Asn)/glutamyl-tRNA(Gln) amidotransferase subunit A
MSEELTWMPAWRIRELIGKKEVSPVEVTDHFLGRIEEHDPVLKAFTNIDYEGARAQANAATKAVIDGGELGPLHGIPISVKEHVSVAGLPVMDLSGEGDHVAEFDDLGVTRLRQAGAVIVGTNTMMYTGSKGGVRQFNWDKEARNAWDPTRVPGWSSSGGASTTAARLLPIAIGSDGGGSTRLPGAYSGVIAVHPSSGMIPTYNPSRKVRRDSTVTIGPMTRDVTDAAIALQAMAGPDGRDFDCIQSRPSDVLAHLDDGAEGMRLAWTDDFGYADMYAFEQSKGVIAAIRDAAMTLRSVGATIEVTDEVFEDFWPSYVTTSYLFGGGAVRNTVEPETAVFRDALEIRGRYWNKLRALLDQHDLLIAPTAQITAPKVEDWASYWAGQGPVPFPHGTFAPHYTSHTHIFNWLGFPAVNVPAGFIEGLPIGLQIIGWPGCEDKILRLAQAFLQLNPRDERPPVS